MSDDNKVVTFQRRLVNEWPKTLHIADFGDGDGARPYEFIQHPDDTTPKYVRADIHEALLAQARAEGRAEGIREAAQVAVIPCYETRHVTLGDKVYDAILALIEAPAPAPAQPSVHEAALVLAGAMERREWAFYPIEMPVSSDGNGPATVGVDASYITYEVWEAATLKAISSHENLPDAITVALRAIASEDQT